MKLCKLKLKNLNSFRGEFELDFESPPLDEASLVAITGPTGAGKTTLLDAICVALYGKTPRLAGQEPRIRFIYSATVKPIAMPKCILSQTVSVTSLNGA